MKKFILATSLIAAGSMLANAEENPPLLSLDMISQDAWTSLSVTTPTELKNGNTVIAWEGGSANSYLSESWQLSFELAYNPNTTDTTNTLIFQNDGINVNCTSKEISITSGTTTKTIAFNGSAVVAITYLESNSDDYSRSLSLTVGNDSVTIAPWYESTLHFDYNNADTRLWTHSGKFQFSSISLKSATAIPEPSAFGLLAGVGALALVASRRRRK